MKKSRIITLISVTLALVMVFGLAYYAIAGSGPSVTTSMKGNDVTITVKDGQNVLTSVVTFEKNKTVTYEVEGYYVQIVYNGGGVKSAGIVSAPATAVTVEEVSNAKTVYLKGSGGDFSAGGWQNIFYLGGAENPGNYDPSVWHLVVAPPKEAGSVTYMQVAFTNGEVFKWNPADGFSTNSGGNNPGWVIVAPYNWQIAYVNSGSNNTSESYLLTTGDVNNFNISGFHQGVLYGRLSFEKTVEGKLLVTLLLDKGFTDEQIRAILSGVSFELYSVAANGSRSFYASRQLTDSGVIDFGRIPVGNYVVVERLTGSAAVVFEQHDDVYITVYENGATGFGFGKFDYDALYTIVNGYSNRKVSGGTLNYPGLNNNGDLFYIGVTNTNTGVEYASYCANAGSQNFAGDAGQGCAGYMVADSVASLERVNAATYADFLSALNYIEDVYGNLNDNRAVTQTVIWALLGAVDVNSEAWKNVWISVAEIAAVEDVMANYKGYTGSGKIVDLVYMVCENHEHTFLLCQPQLVPIYNAGVDNKTKDIFGSATFNKTVYGNTMEGFDSASAFAFELYKKDANGDYTILIGEYSPDANGVVSAGGLEPGDYVFRELPKLFWDEPVHGDDGDYNLVWAPMPKFKAVFPEGDDGLYFEISKLGETKWQDYYELDQQGNPTVDNVITCKHNAFWNNLDYYYGTNPHTATRFADGWLIDFDDFCTGHLVPTFQAPQCEVPGYIWLSCSEKDNGCIVSTSIRFADPLGHDYQPSGQFKYNDDYSVILGEYYTCSHCGANIYVPVEEPEPPAAPEPSGSATVQASGAALPQGNAPYAGMMMPPGPAAQNPQDPAGPQDPTDPEEPAEPDPDLDPPEDPADTLNPGDPVE